MRFKLVAPILGSPHGFDVILERDPVRFLLECLAGEPTAMTQRPVLPGFVGATVPQEKSEKLLAGAHQLHDRIDPCADEVTHRLVNFVGHPHRREIARPMLQSQFLIVSPVGFDPIARLAGNQRRRGHGATMAEGS